MAVLAARCPECQVTVVDIDEKKVAAWQTGEPPIYEPGLKAVLQETLGRNLSFSTDVPRAIEEAEAIFVSVNTPTKDFGAGAGMAADLQYWEKTARQIMAHSTTDKIVIEKSTVPVRTARAMERILNSNERGIHFEVLSNPEFMAEGTAIQDLETPDRVLIGGHDSPTGRKAVAELVDVYANWVARDKILTMNVWSSELSKLAANAFLAQRVSSINSISALAEATDADVDEVARAVGMDSRIGARFLKASVGFGGSCFKKDLLNLVYLSRFYGLEEVAEYWHQVVSMNQHQKKRFVKRVVHSMFNTVVDKRIAVLGFAFKANTGDTRDSPAIEICRDLLAEKALLAVSDPQALPAAKEILAAHMDSVTLELDPYEAATGAHALLILTEWQQYRDLDFERILGLMAKPAFIFDGRNILDHQRLFDIGFNVFPLGKAPLSHV
jgi:UDPglucose 6-dehydrogenase